MAYLVRWITRHLDLPRFNALIDHLFRVFEDMYYQKLEGHLDPRVWRGSEAPMRDIIAYPGIQAWWRSRSHWFSQEFGEFVNAQARSAGPPSLYREDAGNASVTKPSEWFGPTGLTNR
jgi:hypothetical protein